MSAAHSQADVQLMALLRRLNSLASRPGAYTESTLGVFESGDGAVIGGVLLTKGMVGKHKSELWIATSPKELVNPATGKTMAAEVLASDLGLDLYRIDLSRW